MDSTYMLLPYIISVAILVVVPGIDTAIFIKALISDGRHQAFRSSLGVAAGCLCWGMVVTIGISDYIYNSPPIYNSIRYLGSFYLIYLAIQSLKSLHANTTYASPPGRNWMRIAFLSNILNPKIGLFYIAVIPSFLTSSSTSLKIQSIRLIGIHIVIYIIWSLILLILAEKFVATLQSVKVIKIMNYITSLLFLCLATNLILSE